MIVSVHLPKTAGTSFAAALKTHFGDRLQRDYADRPINTPVYDRNQAALRAAIKIAKRGLHGTECVHGHFLPVKYLLLSSRQDVQFVAWMRDPVERLVSHYHFWRNEPKATPVGRLRSQMLAEQWSLERFCLGPELQNLYGQFLWGFPLERFDFIGSPSIRKTIWHGSRSIIWRPASRPLE